MFFPYSMQTTIPFTINKASREFDESKILTLGPYASILAIIIQKTELKYRHKENDSIVAKRINLFREDSN